MKTIKPMHKWKTSSIMFLGTWIGFIIMLPMIHYMTLPYMRWGLVFKLDGICCVTMSIVFAFIGWTIDCTNRRHVGQEMLRKLES